MWKKVKKYAIDHGMFEKNDHILIGLSGGADSVCLFRFLLDIAEKYELKIYAVHINHMIRDQGAQRDENFVRDLCAWWDVPLSVFKIDVPAYAKKHHMTEEEAGRDVRYQCFEKTAREQSCQKIAVAHHADDLAETVLFRMIRGTGLLGLGAIRPVYEGKIRPLLCLTKCEILEILEKLGQDYIEDETNTDVEYSRNYIRHEILPRLSDINPKASQHMAQLSLQAQELEQFLEPIFEKCYQECVERKKDRLYLSIERYQQLQAVPRDEVIRRILFEAAGRRKDISKIHVDKVKKLVDQKSGSSINLPYNIVAVKESDQLRFMSREQFESCSDKIEEICYEISLDKASSPVILKTKEGMQFIFSFEAPNLSDYTKGDCVKYFDYDKIDKDVCIRNQKDGDYFIADKQKHKKMLRRYFIDEKIPRDERKNKLLFASGSHVLWIVGGRICESCKVTESTKRVLKITWYNIEE